MYLTGDIKKKIGITSKQIDRWTELGWVREFDKTEHGYRIYDEKALERFRLIRFYRLLGMGTKEISKVLAGGKNEIERYYQDQISMIEKKITGQKQQLRLLEFISATGIENIDLARFDNKAADEIVEMIAKNGGRL